MADRQQSTNGTDPVNVLDGARDVLHNLGYAFKDGIFRNGAHVRVRSRRLSSKRPLGL
jgi:hypothetical protein